MELKTKAFAAFSAKSPLAPFTIERRQPGKNDVLIEILYCGVCHSDLHMARDEWGWTQFPLVPGHEIVGRVKHVGTQVQKFKVDDLVGVGCFVDSCRKCQSCKEGLEQYCDQGFISTYNSMEQDGKAKTYGGYSNQIVVDENYVLRVPENLTLSRVAPLLCAGITTYSPLKHCKVGSGHRVAVLGLGGLGHMAVKMATSMGATVAVLSSSKEKEKDALQLGAQEFFLTSDQDVLPSLANRFDFVIDAVSAPHNYNSYINLLKRDGTMILLGVPNKPADIEVFPLISKRRTLMGTLIGGIAETQEMLDYCSEKQIICDIEVIKMSQIDEAYDRMIKGDVRYRFVIDMKTL